MRLSDERLPLPTSRRLARELWPIVAEKLSPIVWQQMLDDTLMALAGKDLVSLVGQHFRVTKRGKTWRDARLGYAVPTGLTWPKLRDVHLMSRALGLSGSAPKVRELLNAGGLRRLVLEQGFGIRLRGREKAAGTRDILARLALRRGTASGELARASSRLDAAQRRAQAASLIGLAPVPSNDNHLIAAIAAGKVGAPDTSSAALRLQLLRRYMTREGLGSATKSSANRRRKPAKLTLEAFISAVRDTTGRIGQGWSGNRKALISRVFPALIEAHPEWGLDMARYKSLLIEAHQAGRLQLVHADLKDKKIQGDLAASATAYRNMILHYVRVEDQASDAA